MFMDRHQSIDLSPEELAAAHMLDLEAQDKYGVRYHTYWFDPERQSLFCLAEGATKDAIEAVHRDAHGVTADAIVEVDPNIPLNAMFGSLPAHPPGEAYTAPAMRAIVFTDVCGSVAQTHELGDEGHLALLHDHNELVRSELARHDGREVKHTGDGIMASFASVSAAVAFAIGVQTALHKRNEHAPTALHVSIGISAGEPITDDNDDLFGAAVQLAARLCDAAQAGDIAVSIAVHELCMGKQFRFEDRGAIPLKGLPEQIQAYSVIWRD
jgi:class 3 adenylate cyclase